MNKRTLRWSVLLAAAVVGAAMLWEGLVSAKPPAPPPTPPPPGSICFWNPGPPAACWAMNGDGSGKHALTPPDFFGVPTNTDHGGHTWWLCMEADPDGGYYPGSTNPVLELYLVLADSQSITYSVQLTNLGPGGITPACYEQARASWSNDLDDSFVSFIGWDRAQSKYFLYRAHIAFPNTGDPFLLEEPAPILEVPSRETAFHWSPDGNKLVYEGTSASPGINVYDLAANTVTKIYATGAHHALRWSPPGVPERIAFDSGWGVYTIAPDGTDFKVAYDVRSQLDYMRSPYWSPDGKYLACRNILGKMGKGGVGYFSEETAIVPSQGGAKTILTADMPNDPGQPVVWRRTTPAP